MISTSVDRSSMVATSTKSASRSNSVQRARWLCLTRSCTFFIPDILLKKVFPIEAVRTAWREKLALNFIIWLLCGFMLFFIIGFSRIICPPLRILSQGEIDALNTFEKPFVSIYGHYYKIGDVVKTHVEQQAYLNEQAMKSAVLGKDVSAMFYKTPFWSKYCPGISQAAGWDNIQRDIPSNIEKLWYPHQGQSQNRQIDYLKEIAYMRKGTIARNEEWISKYLAADTNVRRIIQAYGRVYDVSSYSSPSNTNNFLGKDFQTIFRVLGTTGKDATPFLEQIRKNYSKQEFNALINCMDNLFFTGVIDNRNSIRCIVANYILLASTILLVAVIGFKFIAALQNLSARKLPSSFSRSVIIQIPCYTEGVVSISKALESIADTRYNDEYKFLFIVCDGVVTGSENDKSTPEIVLDLLGVKNQGNSLAKSFESIGEGNKMFNRGNVYSGLYKYQGHSIPFVVVVKIGNLFEDNQPGNRGKRDSQMILLRFLSRAHFGSPMNPLELDIYRHMFLNLKIQPENFEFILMVDADTEVLEEGLNRLVAGMIRDSKIIGLCGETVIGNPTQTWVVMIQIYEYFISHHLAKAFESMFGSVTCLPGCFSMYRIKYPLQKIPIIIAPAVVKAYSESVVNTLHKKNLLSLGEDRYLTTIMMKTFPDLRLSFTSDAKAKTSVPSRWSVFLSQRRRWINSTVHNLFELLNLPQLCGFCCFSMRFVVFLDLFATLIQPAAIVYVGYLFYSIFGIEDETATFPLISLIMIGAIYGLQVIILLFQGEWQNIGWLVIYIFALPLYSFYLPLYSFWQFDNFSWGNTRMVMVNEDETELVEEIVEEVQLNERIPLFTWTEYLGNISKNIQNLSREDKESPAIDEEFKYL